MNEKSRSQPKLKLIRGGLDPETTLAFVRIVAAARHRPPFPIDAMVVEEDTFLVLSADRRVKAVKENLLRLMTEIIETKPKELGSIIVRNKRPLQFLAIVHDLNQEPSWKEEWIGKALEEIFQEVERRRLKSLALPLLGTLYGSLEKSRFAVLLRDALLQTTFQHLKQLWLVVPRGTAGNMIRIIETGGPLF